MFVRPCIHCQLYKVIYPKGSEHLYYYYILCNMHIIQFKICYFQLFFMVNIIFCDNLFLIFKEKICIISYCINTQVLSEYLLLKLLFF